MAKRKNKKIKYALWIVLDQIVGYLTKDKTCTTKCHEAILFNSAEDAIKFRPKQYYDDDIHDPMWKIEVVEDERWWKNRGDLW